MQSSPKKYLGLDLGKKLGYAACQDGKIMVSGTLLLSKNPNDPVGKRYATFEAFLSKVALGVDGIYYEVVNSHGQWNTSLETYHGLLAILQKFQYFSHVPITGIHLIHLKKAFTGNAKAKKHDMCAKAHELGWIGGRLGTDKDDDEADACAALIVGMRETKDTIVTF